MKFFQSLFLFSFFIFLQNNCCAQIYNFKVFDEDNGLPQNYVYSISQNAQGFLLLSTGDGFAKFDGNKFKSFTIKDSLCENFVNLHFTDSRGITWLGHYQNGISYLKNDKFFKVKDSDKYGSTIISFAEDKKKNIWFAVQGKGVFFIDSNFTIQTPRFDGEENANCLCIDSSGFLLCGTDNGLFVFDIKNPTKPKSICSLGELQNKSIKLIVKDAVRKNSFWVAVPGEGVYGLQPGIGLYKIASSITTELKSSSKNFSCIYSDHLGNLWISLSGEGIKKIIFQGKNEEDIFSVQSIDKTSGLKSLFIPSIFEDYEGNMWLGTFGAGLIQMPEEPFNFYIPGINNDTKSIAIDHLGNFWLGTSTGILQYNISKPNETKLFDSKNGFVNDQVNSVFLDKKGMLWIGTENSGVFTLNPETEKFENFSKEKQLKFLSVNCITESNENQILIATKEGVYFYTPETSKIVLVTTVEGLLHNDVGQIFCDNENRIWFCSHGTPPYFLKHDEFTVLKEIPELKTFNINAVADDGFGMVWIATEGDGVFSYDGKNIKNFRVEDGLISNFCYSIICNASNEIWVAHKNGLSCIKNSGKNILQFNKSDGLLFPENNLNSTLKDMTGNLWFGTTDGLVEYNSDLNEFKKTAPITSILSLALNDKTFKVGDEIDLPYNKYSVQINYIGISLIDPTKINYKYRLLGFDTAWRFTNERIAEFPKIGDGTYTFQVIACNRDGVWNNKPAEITFEIDEPIWEKIWFWILATVLFVTLVYLLVRSRINSLLKAKLKLEMKVAEKTRQLQEEKVQLENVKLMLEEKDKDITDSITYAKKIQEALLPTKENLLKNFPKTFIFYKPRDIVSGDFYWFSETEHYFVVAVVDCTGHGIPGAFMSLIGSTLINEIIYNKKIEIPSKILTELDKGIVKSLRQDGNHHSSRDGMDVSICSIDKAKTKLIFSSAGRPLFYVRENKLEEINLRALPVGGSYPGLTKKYSDVEIDLKPDDMFYFFSDGFADQFNNNNEKKYSTKRMKSLFTEISEMDVTKQYEAVDRSFNQWRGDQNQIDDITIIGLKI